MNNNCHLVHFVHPAPSKRYFALREMAYKFGGEKARQIEGMEFILFARIKLMLDENTT